MPVPTEPIPDPWSDEGVAFRRRWPVVAAAAGGASYVAIWFLAGRPAIYVSRWVVPLSLVVGLVAAVSGPRPRRLARFADWAVAGFVFSMTASVVGVLGQTITGDTTLGANAAVLIVSSLGLVFFGGGALYAARIHRPGKRLAPELLRRIPPPAATRREPRAIDVRLEDGSVESIILMEGGYLAQPRALAAGRVVDVIADGR